VTHELREHIQRVIARSKAFYAARTPGHFLIHASYPAPAGPAAPLPPLWDYDLCDVRQLHAYLGTRLDAGRAARAARGGLEDDSIPAAFPYFGIAEHSAWLGMDVRLQESTCLPLPLIERPEDLDRLEMSEHTPWFEIMREGYSYLRSRADGTFVLGVRGTMMPMDLANAMRGDELFTDFLLDPEFAHRLLDFCTRAVEWYYERLTSWADELDGGHVFAMGAGWLGPHCLGHVSNDAAFMCSATVYEEFGFPYEERLSRGYGGLLYHVHNEKLQFVPRLVQLPRLALLEISQDPRTPPPVEDLPRIFANTGSANLLLHMSSDQTRKHVEELKQRNVFLDVHCRDRVDANDIVAFVRSHSANNGE